MVSVKTKNFIPSKAFLSNVDYSNLCGIRILGSTERKLSPTIFVNNAVCKYARHVYLVRPMHGEVSQRIGVFGSRKALQNFKIDMSEEAQPINRFEID